MPPSSAVVPTFPPKQLHSVLLSGCQSSHLALSPSRHVLMFGQWLLVSAGLCPLSPLSCPPLTQNCGPPGLKCVDSPQLHRVSGVQVPQPFQLLSRGRSMGGAAGDSFSLRSDQAWGVRWQLQAGCITLALGWEGVVEGISGGPGAPGNSLLVSGALDPGEAPAHRRRWGRASSCLCRPRGSEIRRQEVALGHRG